MDWVRDSMKPQGKKAQVQWVKTKPGSGFVPRKRNGEREKIEKVVETTKAADNKRCLELLKDIVEAGEADQDFAKKVRDLMNTAGEQQCGGNGCQKD